MEAKNLSDFSKAPQSSDALPTDIQLLCLERMDQESKQATGTNHIIIIPHDFVSRTAALCISSALKSTDQASGSQC